MEKKKKAAKMRRSMFSLMLVLAFALVFGMNGLTLNADELTPSDQSADEAPDYDFDSGNGGDAGGDYDDYDSGGDAEDDYDDEDSDNNEDIDEEDSGNGGDVDGDDEEEDSGNGGDVGLIGPELEEELLDAEEEKRPILITSAEELRKLSSAVNSGDFVETYGKRISKAKIRLENDIDLSGGFEPIGNGDHMFTGEFDGNGFTISNLTILEDGEIFLGLFGILGKGANIHDVSLTGVQISGRAVVGGIAGIANFAVISNCSVEGELFVSDSLVGGIAGVAIESKIENCVTGGSVEAAIENAGGIVGQAAYSNCVIRNCSSSMTVTVPWGAGGLAGSVMNAEVEGGGFSGELISMSDAAGSMVGDVMEVEALDDEIESEYQTDYDTNDLNDTDDSSPSEPGDKVDPEESDDSSPSEPDDTDDTEDTEEDEEPEQPDETESEETEARVDVV